MPTLLDEAIFILCTTPEGIQDKIMTSNSRLKLMKKWKGRYVKTLYGKRKLFKIGGLTRLRANSLHAYGRLAQPFNVSVSAHFYVRHRIYLSQPFLPCIIELCGRSERGLGQNDDKYYPLEMLELLPEREKTPPPQIFKKCDDTILHGKRITGIHLEQAESNNDTKLLAKRFTILRLSPMELPEPNDEEMEKVREDGSWGRAECTQGQCSSSTPDYHYCLRCGKDHC